MLFNPGYIPGIFFLYHKSRHINSYFIVKLESKFLTMKKFLLLISICLVLISCKVIAKTAVKYWGKKKSKEWLVKCEEHSSKLLGAERAEEYCDCAIEKVATKYNNYEDVVKAGMIEALLVAKECK